MFAYKEGTPRAGEASRCEAGISAQTSRTCRRLAGQLTNEVASELFELAAEYEAEAIEHSQGGQMQAGDGPDDSGQNQQQG